MSTNPGSFGLPDRSAPVASGNVPKDGGQVNTFLNDLWARWAVRISQLTAERPIAPVAAGASPFAYTATTIGHFLVRGGTVSSVTLTRGSDTVVCPTSGFVPMAAEDVVTVTYSVAPTVTFVPSARA